MVSRSVDYLVKIKKVDFFELLPLANLDIESCNEDIWKTIIARSFKHGQLIEKDQ